MALILSIESSTPVCSVAVHREGNLIATSIYHLGQSHSKLLTGIIKELLERCDLDMKDLDAIAVAGGPGSYTGLRIGVSTAKGIAYATQTPLISVNSLDLMYEQVASILRNDALFCPMIDARRMEVYCQLRNKGGEFIWETKPMIVEKDSFEEIENKAIYLFGNGAAKCKEVLDEKRFLFIENIHPEAQYMGRLAFEHFQTNKFEDIAYFEPDYLKEYRTNQPAAKFKL